MMLKDLNVNMLAVALACAAGASQAEMTLNVPPGAESHVLVGGLAERILNIGFDAPFSFGSGSLHLSFDSALAFLPDQSTIEFGNLFMGSFSEAQAALNLIETPDSNGCAVTLLYSYCASYGTPGQIDLSVTLPPAALLLDPGSVEMHGQQVQLKLVFQGNAVGDYAVHYALDAVDNDFTQTPDFAGNFSTIYVQAIPEPATYALMLGGLVAVGALARRRRSTV